MNSSKSAVPLLGLIALAAVAFGLLVFVVLDGPFPLGNKDSDLSPPSSGTANVKDLGIPSEGGKGASESPLAAEKGTIDERNEDDIKESLQPRGDGFVLEGTVYHGDTGPAPTGLRIVALRKKPFLGKINVGDLSSFEEGDPKARAAVKNRVMRGEEWDELVNASPVVSVGEDGAFRFDVLKRGAYYVFPLHPTLRTIHDHAFEANPPDAEKKDSDPVLVVLEDAAVIEGTVLTPDGRPAADAELTLAEEFDPFQALSGRISSTSPFTVRTETKGRFRFEQVPLGKRYFIEAKCAGFGPVRRASVTVSAGATIPVMLRLLPAAVIAGRVEGDDGKPYPGASLKLMNAQIRIDRAAEMGGISSESDSSGRFVFVDLAPGDYNLRLFEPGFLRKTVKHIKVGAGERSDRIVIRLEKGLELRGHVVDESGSPLEGILCRGRPAFDLIQFYYHAMDQQYPYEAVTDREGRFVFAGLEKGRYDLEAESDAFARTRMKKVEAGRDDVTLTLRTGARIEGIVFSAVDGGPVRRYTIDIQDRNGEGNDLLDPFRIKDRKRRTVDGQDGRFALGGLRSGVYDLTFKAPGFGVRKLERVRLAWGEVKKGVIVSLPGESSISGTVRDELTGEPVTGAMISRRSGLKGMIEGLIEQDGAYTDAEGDYRLGGLSAGTLRLVVSHPRYKDASVEELVLNEGQRLEGVDVALSRGSVVAGKVLRGDRLPVRGAHILISDLSGSKLKSAKTAETGEYEVWGLSKGTYTVTKLPRAMDFSDGAMTGDWLSEIKTQTVRVGETDQRYEVNFILGDGETSGVEVTGVVREEGNPVNRAIVSLFRLRKGEASFQPKTTSTGKDGRYTFENVKPGDYTLRVVKTSSITAGAACEIVFNVKVPDRSRFLRDLVLPGGGVKGIVRDRSTRAPLEGIRIVLCQAGSGTSADTFSRAMGNRVAEVYTNSKGTFRISNLREGRYRLRAGGGNLFGMNTGGYAVERLDPFEIEGVGSTKELEIPLEKGGNLKGVVTDPLGLPLAGASVHIRDEDGLDFEAYSECVTDPTGFYRYQGLKPGRCDVLIKHADHALFIEKELRIRKERTETLNAKLQKGCALYLEIAGVDPQTFLDQGSLTLKDEQGANLFGHLSLLDVMDSFFGGSGSGGKGLFLGRFVAGAYQIEVTHPAVGTETRMLEVAPTDQEQVITLNGGTGS